MAVLKAGAASRAPNKLSTLSVTDSGYAKSIPVVYGHERTSALLIYWNNFTAVAQSGKKQSKTGGQSYKYYVDVDMILGYGPMEGVAAIWDNGTWLHVAFGNESFTTGTGTDFTFTIDNIPPDINGDATGPLIMIMGVQVILPFNVSYNDYAGPGVTRSINMSGDTIQPVNNNFFPAPNQGFWQYANLPYAQYNSTYGDDTIEIIFPNEVSGVEVVVYYCFRLTNGQVFGVQLPLAIAGLAFETELGTGPEGAPQQYVEFSGVGGAQIPLGTQNVLPQFNFEVKGLYGLGNTAPATQPESPGVSTDPRAYVNVLTSGDCNPADVIIDIICSGNFYPTWVPGPTPNPNFP